MQLKPELAILDIQMPRLNGLEATRQIRQQEPQTAILIMTIDESEYMFAKCSRRAPKAFCTRPMRHAA